MADDTDKMTQGLEKSNLEDGKTNDLSNEDGNELNDNPEDVSPEEFEALNSQMDQLNSALDVLEEQNDLIHAKLMDLLESNRAARKQFQEELEKKGSKQEKKK